MREDSRLNVLSQPSQENGETLKYESLLQHDNLIDDHLNKKKLPNQLMLTFHPQRWSSNILIWTQELVLQNLKNFVKKQIVHKTKG